MATNTDFIVKNGLVVTDSSTFGNTITGTNAVFTGTVTASNILDSADVIGIIASEGLDSNLVTSIVDSAYIVLRDRFQDSSLVTSTVTKAYVDALNIDADTLDGQTGTFYLNYTNFSNTPNVLDSVDVTNIVDSAYVLARAGSAGIDSDAVKNLLQTDITPPAIAARNSSVGNVLIGDSAGALLGTSNTDVYNVAIGYQALSNDYNVYDAVAIGKRAGKDSSSPLAIHIGADADGAGDIIIGRAAQGGGSQSTLVGRSAYSKYSGTTVGRGAGAGDVAIGFSAAFNLRGSHNNIGTTAVGSNALRYMTGAASTAWYNTAVGYRSGYALTTGEKNTLIGGHSFLTSPGPTTGSNNIVIGYGAGTEIGNESSGVLLLGDSAISKFRIPGLNVDTSKASNGQYLSWNTGTGKFQWTTASAGGGTVDSAYVLSVVDSAAIPFTQKFYHFTADSGQKTFSGFDDDSDTLAYSTGALAVYLNGILLVDSVDYTASTGTSIVLTDSAALGDVLTVLKFGGNTTGIDSAGVINLIDSAYIAARTTAGTDSAAIIQLIDSAYVQARQTDVYRDSAFVDLVIEKHLDLGEFILGGDPGVLQYVDFVSEVAGTNGAVRAGSGLSKTGGTGWTSPAYFSVDSSFVTGLIDSAYIQARDRYRDSAFVTNIIDSAYVEARQSNVFNRVYVSGQDEFNADSTRDQIIFEAGTGITLTTDANTDTLTISAHEAHFPDSASINVVIQDLVDSAYVQLRQSAVAGGGGGTDSATVITLINSTVDSDYIGTKVDFTRGEFTTDRSQYTATASQTVFNHSSKDPANLDVYLNGILQVVNDDYTATSSAVTFTTGVDSGYSVSIVERRGRILTQRGLVESKYYYTTTTPTTVFSGADDAGNTLDYSVGFADVYLNGILLRDSDDYTTNAAGSSITLVSATDSSDLLTVINRKGVVVSPNVKNYEFTATAGQTTFSGADINSNTLSYVPGAVQVHLNGILLRNADFTAVNGTSVVLTDSASLNDELVVSAFSNPGQNMDLYKFTADSGQTVFQGTDLAGASLAYQPGNIQVFMNGLLLNDSDDYTANNGISVVLTSGADLSDEIKIASFVTNSDAIRTNAWSAPTDTTVQAYAGDKLFIDVTSSAKTVTLPSSATMGDEIRIIDAVGNAATNNITVSRNGHKISGDASDLTINVDRAGIGLVYYNTAQGWLLIEN